MDLFSDQLSPLTRPSWSTDKKTVVGVAAVAAVFGAFWLGPKVLAAIVAA